LGPEKKVGECRDILTNHGRVKKRTNNWGGSNLYTYSQKNNSRRVKKMERVNHVISLGKKGRVRGRQSRSRRKEKEVEEGRGVERGRRA